MLPVAPHEEHRDPFWTHFGPLHHITLLPHNLLPCDLVHLHYSTMIRLETTFHEKTKRGEEKGGKGGREGRGKKGGATSSTLLVAMEV